MKSIFQFAAPLLVPIFLTGCGASEDSDNTDPSPTQPEQEAPISGWYTPDILSKWHIQLQGDLQVPEGIEVLEIDLFDNDSATIAKYQARGIKVICYFSAGTREDWREDANKFLQSDIGNDLGDWPGEAYVDVRSENVRSIMKGRLNLAAEKGCDAVDPDNVDAWNNDNGLGFTSYNQIDYNIFLADAAHDNNLGIGLKNDLLHVESLVDHFDFAVNEQCFAQNNCEYLQPFIDQNKAVFNVEYSDIFVNSQSERDALCMTSINLSISSIVMPIMLDGSSVIKDAQCPD